GAYAAPRDLPVQQDRRAVVAGAEKDIVEPDVAVAEGARGVRQLLEERHRARGEALAHLEGLPREAVADAFEEARPRLGIEAQAELVDLGIDGRQPRQGV